jgi:thioredoxin reductase (NADPH)
MKGRMMTNPDAELRNFHLDDSPETRTLDWVGSDFRHDLAFPRLTEDMLQRIRPYGHEESFPANVTLFTHGDREVDMFVVLDGGVDSYIPDTHGGQRSFGRHRTSDFTGEFNLLTAQGAVVEARTVRESRLLRITRKRLQELMRAEGDVANLVVQAAIWRRIGIVKAASSGVVLIGHSDDAATTRLQRFLVRNSYPHRVIGPSLAAAELKLSSNTIFPAVVLADGRTICRPTISEIADELGITELPDSGTIHDVAVVGAGPAGLAAAVYAASEGLRTIVIESMAPGGQAGTSSKIENYLGFPTGIGGQQLASRAHLQALKFGVQFLISRETVSAEMVNGIHKLALSGDIAVRARSVVVATGAQYRKLDVTNYAQYENQGLFYAATAMEAALCRGDEVIVVGGGNSAGQAAIFLASTTKHVHHLVRGSSLSSTMSQYLISRIESSSHISIHTDSEIVALGGASSLESVTWIDRKTGERTERQISNVFVMIGAEPNSGWLYGAARLDNKGFILTGGSTGFENSPYATSVPGIFAVGDIRANSVKRIASAVGEGSVVISDVHRYLADHRDAFGTQQGSGLDAIQATSNVAL